MDGRTDEQKGTLVADRRAQERISRAAVTGLRSVMISWRDNGEKKKTGCITGSGRQSYFYKTAKFSVVENVVVLTIVGKLII